MNCAKYNQPSAERAVELTVKHGGASSVNEL
jgi:hypothetical protein